MGEFNLIKDKYFDYRQFADRNKNIALSMRDVNTVNSSAIERIHFHCTDANGWSPAKLSKFFIEERKFSVCSYHYYVTEEKIYHMVDESIVTPNAAPYNKTSIAFAIDYHASKCTPLNIKPSEKLIVNSINLVAYLSIKWRIDLMSIFGHREIPQTGWFFNQSGHKVLRKECPGLLIDLDDFRIEVSKTIKDFAVMVA